MITPDPNLPDHANTDMPIEPISWTLDRIEAMSELYQGPPPVCLSGCTPTERRIIEMGGELPKVLGYSHEPSCERFEV